MTCTRLQNQLDEYMDEALSQSQHLELEHHVQDCVDCQAVLESEQLIRKGFKQLPVSGPSETFLNDAFAAVRVVRSETPTTGFKFVAAIAASLALMFAVVLTQLPEDSGASLSGVTMAVNQPQTVNLMFASAEALEDVTLIVELPDGVEVAGFAGRKTLRWRTSLREGKNVLPLELVAKESTAGEVVAFMKHGDKEKTFRLRVKVTEA